jgi:uncharacterized phage protein (TIGR02220 family)
VAVGRIVVTWVAVDDGFPDHPKILALGEDAPAGMALYIASMCWCGKHLTDGALPYLQVPRLVPYLQDAERIADRLLEVGLFERNGKGWKLHDWADYQRSKARAEYIRGERAKAGRRGGLSKAENAAKAQVNVDVHGDVQNAPANPSKNPSKSKQTASKRLAKGYSKPQVITDVSSKRLANASSTVPNSTREIEGQEQRDSVEFAEPGESLPLFIDDSAPPPTSKSERDITKQVVEHLNAVSGSRYRATSDATKLHLVARINDGYTLDDLMQVVDGKCADWLDDPKMRRYLRPETLFAGKFEGYLSESSMARNGSRKEMTPDGVCVADLERGDNRRS